MLCFKHSKSFIIKTSVLIFLSILGIKSLMGQNKTYYLSLEGSEEKILTKQAEKLRQYHFDLKGKINAKIEHLKSYFVENGYLEASVDSTFQIEDTVYAIFHIGKPYVWK